MYIILSWLYKEPTVEYDKFIFTPRKNSDQELNRVKNYQTTLIQSAGMESESTR